MYSSDSPESHEQPVETPVVDYEKLEQQERALWRDNYIATTVVSLIILSAAESEIKPSEIRYPSALIAGATILGGMRWLYKNRELPTISSQIAKMKAKSTE